MLLKRYLQSQDGLQSFYERCPILFIEYPEFQEAHEHCGTSLFLLA